MNVSLTSELERFVNEQVASGMYYSASEVVREGLRLLREKELLHQAKLHELRGEVERGMKDVESGAVTAYSVESLDELGASVKQQGRIARARTQE